MKIRGEIGDPDAVVIVAFAAPDRQRRAERKLLSIHGRAHCSCSDAVDGMATNMNGATISPFRTDDLTDLQAASKPVQSQ